jgi:hypothetical protein
MKKMFAEICINAEMSYKQQDLKLRTSYSFSVQALTMGTLLMGQLFLV